MRRRSGVEGAVAVPRGRTGMPAATARLAAMLVALAGAASLPAGACAEASDELAAAAPAEAGEGAASAGPHDAAAQDAATSRSRFFRSGDGEIALESAHTGEHLRVRYRSADGSYDPKALAAIDRLFRSRGDDERTRVSLRLIEMIDSLQDTKHPRAIALISGYRSGEYNASLIARGRKAARSSMHTEGLAADLRFAGLDQRALWDEVRALECCGAGYYESSGFLHLDVGKPRFWEQGTSRVGENLSKGNARVIARTDYDRYGELDGARVRLHAVTLRPLRISRAARFAPSEGGAEGFALRVASADGALVAEGECIEFRDRGDVPARIALQVEPASAGAAAGERTGPGAPTRGHIVLSTCEPRLEATAETIETNLIEIAVPWVHGRSGGRSDG